VVREGQVVLDREPVTAGHEGARHQGEVADAIIAACS
jgi:hypothetical protein